MWRLHDGERRSVRFSVSGDLFGDRQNPRGVWRRLLAVKAAGRRHGFGVLQSLVQRPVWSALLAPIMALLALAVSYAVTRPDRTVVGVRPSRRQPCAAFVTGMPPVTEGSSPIRGRVIFRLASPIAVSPSTISSLPYLFSLDKRRCCVYGIAYCRMEPDGGFSSGRDTE